MQYKQRCRRALRQVHASSTQAANSPTQGVPPIYATHLQPRNMPAATALQCFSRWSSSETLCHKSWIVVPQTLRAAVNPFSYLPAHSMGTNIPEIHKVRTCPPSLDR